MLTIRLKRTGTTKRPFYRLIISEKARDTQGTYLEALGTFNPHDKVTGLKADVERIKYWIGKGAQTSSTIHNLLVKAGVIVGDKKRVVHISKVHATKLDTKKKAAQAKAEKAAAPAPAPEVAPEATPESAPEVAPETTPAE